MITTECGTINVTIATDVSDVVFQPSDWSMINIPLDEKRVKTLSNNLFNQPSNRHVCLLLNRHKKKDHIKGIQHTHSFITASKWELLDSVSIGYSKPATSGKGLLHLCEGGLVLYKGDTPDVEATNWASESYYSNVTNEWVLMSHDFETSFLKTTYCKKFSWDLHLILQSLCGHLEYKRFIYGIPVKNITENETKSLYLFCRYYNLKVELVAESNEEAAKFLDHIKKIEKKLLSEVLKK
jgi:hypothetical protein